MLPADLLEIAKAQQAHLLASARRERLVARSRRGVAGPPPARQRECSVAPAGHCLECPATA